MYVEKLPSGWKKNREKAFSKSLFALTDGGCARFARVKQNGSKFVQKIHLHRISRNTRTYPVRVFYTHLNIFFACFATHAFIKRGFCTHLNRNGFCPTGLVPRRSPPAHSTRLDAKCRDVTEWGPRRTRSCGMSFGDVTKFCTKSVEREENAWVLGWFLSFNPTHGCSYFV